MLKKPTRTKQIPNQDKKQPQTISELIRRYDLDNTKIYDYLDKLVKELNNQIKIIFPIGSCYVTQLDVNPSLIFGFGTWERLKGRVVVGLDEDDKDFSTIGKEGGSKTHTLIKKELPNISLMLNVKRAGSTVNEKRQWGVNTQIQDNMGDDFTEPLGDGQAFSIQNRYKVVGYMWIRTA